MTGLAGVVLAGGRGRRLGTDKALVRIGAVRLVDRVVDEVARVAAPVVVAAGDRRLPELAVVQVPDVPVDDDGPAGPLAGIVAGLRAVAPAPLVAVVAVDLPGVRGDVLAHLATGIGDADAVVPEVAGRLQPLHAVFARSAEPLLAAALRGGERRVLGALERLTVVVVDERTLRAAGLPTDFARDVDTPADLARWRRSASDLAGPRPEVEHPDERPRA